MAAALLQLCGLWASALLRAIPVARPFSLTSCKLQLLQVAARLLLGAGRARCSGVRGGGTAGSEWIRAGEQPGGQDLSKWGRNGRIEAQRALAAAQVTPMATQKEAGRGKSI